MNTYYVDAMSAGRANDLTTIRAAKRAAVRLAGRIAVYGPWDFEHSDESHGVTTEVERMLFWTSLADADADNDPSAHAAGEITRVKMTPY